MASYLSFASHIHRVTTIAKAVKRITLGGTIKKRSKGLIPTIKIDNFTRRRKGQYYFRNI